MSKSKLYLGEQLDRIMLKQASKEEPAEKSSIAIQDIFTKVAAKLGVETVKPEGVDFGDSFVKYAEDQTSFDAHDVASAMSDVYGAIKVGRITSIDENLRNLFSEIEDDQELASAINIRGLLEKTQGPEA